MQVFEALHFPLTTSKAAQFGELPITRIGIGISTMRPSDALVIESAELTGMDAFEEVVKVEDIAALGDPLKDRLLQARARAGARTRLTYVLRSHRDHRCGNGVVSAHAPFRMWHLVLPAASVTGCIRPCSDQASMPPAHTRLASMKWNRHEDLRIR